MKKEDKESIREVAETLSAQAESLFGILNKREWDHDVVELYQYNEDLDATATPGSLEGVVQRRAIDMFLDISPLDFSTDFRDWLNGENTATARATRNILNKAAVAGLPLDAEQALKWIRIETFRFALRELQSGGELHKRGGVLFVQYPGGHKVAAALLRDPGMNEVSFLDSLERFWGTS